MKKNFLKHQGNPSPLGFSIQGKKANFAVFSKNANSGRLGVFHEGEIIEFPLARTEDVWHTSLDGWEEGMEYAFRFDGPAESLRFRADRWLADPLSNYSVSKQGWSLGKVPPPFDWQGVKKPGIPKEDLIIYEMHIRGFTQCASIEPSARGTFSGMIGKIPYLIDLGINAVELMPIFDFDTSNPNYWGYDPISFFAPMHRYASHEDSISEFKTLVRELHRNGIEILLDVVYNHTGPSCPLMGIDHDSYYIADEQGKDRCYTGCGNTVNTNREAAKNLILSSLRFWASAMQVDGFRFDLASILTRGEDGHVIEHPPILEAIRSDPLLQETKLIAESWDACGLYQVGKFIQFGAWSEWNDRFRDRTREFIKGTDGFAGKFAEVFTGSEFLYEGYTPSRSVNFITAHDGFTLRDLVSYNQKHNRDGMGRNRSWNCGVEGETKDPAILELRERQMRNFWIALLFARGIPMILMGDEYGHTRKGNNNPYTQDNALNWFLWDEMEQRKDAVAFVSALIALRKKHPVLRQNRFFATTDIDWHGTMPFQPDWSSSSRFVACALKGSPSFYVAFNADFLPKKIVLPPGAWKQIVRSDLPWKEHFLTDFDRASRLETSLELPPRSTLVAFCGSNFASSPLPAP